MRILNARGHQRMTNMKIDKRWAWSLFDWAAQPFHTVIVTFIFVPYFVRNIASDAVTGQSLVSIMGIASAIMIAVLAPIMSVMAEKGGGRKFWIFIFSLIYILACLGFSASTNYLWLMLVYVIAYFAIEILEVITNAYLPELGDEKEVGQISGVAWGFGYAGGIVVLMFFLLVGMPAPDKETTIIGLTPLLGKDAALSSGLVAAIWYVIFMIPFFRVFKSDPKKMSLTQGVSAAIAQFIPSIKKIFADKKLTWFFASSMFYRDAFAGLSFFGSIYATTVLNWSLMFLGIYGVILNITGVFGGIIGGHFDKKIGPQKVIKFSIWGFVLVCFIALSTNLTHAMFIPVAEGSKLPHILFFICGMLIGAFAGSLQGASRGMVSGVTSGKMDVGEAFGIYGMTGRATAFLAPFTVLIATQLTQSTQMGAWPIIGLFIISLIFFRKFERA